MLVNFEISNGLCVIQFQQGQRDIFKLEAVTLDEVKQVLIGHDGKGKGKYYFYSSISKYDVYSTQ